jgi:hypothetical protein
MIYRGDSMKRQLSVKYICDAGVFTLPMRFVAGLKAIGYIGNGMIGVVVEELDRDRDGVLRNVYIISQGSNGERVIFVQSYSVLEEAYNRLRTL